MTTVTPIPDSPAPRRFTYVQLAEYLDEVLAFEFDGGPALKRIMAVAKGTHPDRAAQHNAIIAAAQEEIAAMPAESPAELALREMQEQQRFRYQWNADCPWMDKNRPAWSKPENDRYLVKFSPGTCRWKSQVYRLPRHRVFGTVNGSPGDRSVTLGNYEIYLRQLIDERDPHIRIEHGVEGDRDLLDLELDEAADLAKVVLLLLDLAHESDAQ
ncbi:hypothetical protein [Williamsia sterculiae]|uniref:Uncharacterized protein n=1 Tax=Williamsia sterculiae TaxID=1344003 RepID=A0A1N7HBD6_9NOCA|nr:hypothetical protein [Williamsia sterculiae]SIS22194.1 hypothetical protein SAMN05445060_3921 [Williamsia sterculiae]